MVRILSDEDVASVLDLDELLPVVERAFRKQAAGEVESPPRPHYPVGEGLDPERPDEALGTGLTMPAYVHGDEHYANKLVGVHEGNAERGLPTVNAQIALTRADTGLPAAYLAGTRITNARTGCIGGLAARELANADAGGVTVGVLGAGQQARWQTRAIATAVDVAAVRIYSPTPNSREACAADLREEGIAAEAVDSPGAAVREADVVVTATTATDPVFDGGDLPPGTLVVAVGAYSSEMRELDETTLDRAARVYADVPDEVADIGDVSGVLDAGDLVPFADALAGDGRRDPDEILVVESVGTAILDAAAAGHVFRRALDVDAGESVDL